MNIQPLEEIGMEVHKVDQFFRIEKGKGVFIIEKSRLRGTIKYDVFKIKKDMAFVVPAGYYHNVVNSSSSHPLKLYTIYSPKQHSPNVKQLYKK